MQKFVVTTEPTKMKLVKYGVLVLETWNSVGISFYLSQVYAAAYTCLYVGTFCVLHPRLQL